MKNNYVFDIFHLNCVQQLLFRNNESFKQNSHAPAVHTKPERGKV